MILLYTIGNDTGLGRGIGVEDLVDVAAATGWIMGARCSWDHSLTYCSKGCRWRLHWDGQFIAVVTVIAAVGISVRRSGSTKNRTFSPKDPT